MPAPSMLKIKTQSCNRLLKEISSYQAETEQNQRKVDEMKAANADEYDIKQQKRVLADSQMMIPDTQRRLGDALQELKSMLVQQREGASEDDVKAAEEAIENASV